MCTAVHGLTVLHIVWYCVTYLVGFLELLVISRVGWYLVPWLLDSIKCMSGISSEHNPEFPDIPRRLEENQEEACVSNAVPSDRPHPTGDESVRDPLSRSAQSSADGQGLTRILPTDQPVQQHD